MSPELLFWLKIISVSILVIVWIVLEVLDR